MAFPAKTDFLKVYSGMGWMLSQALALMLLLPAAYLTQSEIPRINPHPLIELEVPSSPDEAWKALDRKPHASFVSADESFQRHRVPALNQEIRSWSGTAWRGERISAQLLVWSAAPLSQLRIEPITLAGTQGEKIPVSAMRIRFVRYVVSELPYASRQTRCDEIDPKNAYLLPDLLDPASRFDLPASTTRPIWITMGAHMSLSSR